MTTSSSRRRHAAAPTSAQILLFVPTAVVCLLLFLPLALTVLRVAQDPGADIGGSIGKLWSASLYGIVLRNTLGISTVVTVLCVIAAYPCAVLLSHAPAGLQRAALAVLLGSLWLSVLVRTYCWTFLLQRNGLLSWLMVSLGIWNRPYSNMHTQVAVVLGMMHVLLPLMVLLLWSGTDRRIVALQEVSRACGASDTYYMARLYLPATYRGLFASMTLVFLLSLGFYITPELLGGGKGETLMLSVLIGQQVLEFGNWTMGIVLSMLLVALVVLVAAGAFSLRSVRSLFGEMYYRADA